MMLIKRNKGNRRHICVSWKQRFSVITFIKYVQSQENRKPNNSKIFGSM